VKALVAINPKSGGGKGAVVGAKVRNLLADSTHRISFVEAHSRESSLHDVRHALKGEKFEVLIAVGGDGFIHDLLPLLQEFEVPLLVIPAGTGNDIARSLGTFGMKISDILELPAKQAPAEINVGLISHHGEEVPFVQILSTGFDAVVNERANNFKVIKGKNKYVLAVLEKVWKFKAIEFTLTIDGVKQERRAMLICVANGASYGAGMKIVPFAKDDDGIFDVMVVDQVSPLRLLMVFPRVFFGKHINHPKVHFFTGTDIEISAKTEAFADGERISKLPVHIKVSPRNLQVFRA